MSEDAVQALQFENGQLRAELRAQQAVCNKLRREKEEVLLAIQEAVDQIRALQEELDIRERMFQEYREGKEREVEELTRIKQDLEMRLHRSLEAMEGEGDPTASLKGSEGVREVWSLGSSLPQLSAEEILETLGQWDGMEDTLRLFDDIIRAERSKSQWAPGSPWNSTWRFSLRLHISGPADATPVIETFLKDHMPVLMEQCKTGGCSVAPIHLNCEAVRSLSLEENYLLALSSEEVAKSDIFVCVLQDSADSITKVEVEHGYLNNPNARPAVFLFLPGESKDSSATRLKQRVKKAGRNAKVIESSSVGGGLTQLKSELQRLFKEKFGVLEAVEGDSDLVLERMGLLEDMRVELEQTQVLGELLQESPPSLFGMDEPLERLESYLHEEGPVAAQLVTGHPGLGKSTLLARWIEHLRSSYGDRVLVMYHFIICSCSPSAEGSVIMRRFIQKMMFFCAEGGKVPSNPSQLKDCFTSWLEKLSTHLVRPGAEMAVLVIDNADLISECEQQLSWILQPLPNNICVVLTANEDNYPDSWRALPSPSIPTPTSSDLREMMQEVLGTSRHHALSTEHVGMLAVLAPPVPIWCVLATRHLLSLPVMDTDTMDEVVESFAEYEDVSEVTKHILDEVESSQASLSPIMGKVLPLIYWSRNGLLLTELEQTTSTPAAVIAMIIGELKKRAIITETGGLIRLTHEQVQEAVQMKYCVSPVTDYMLLWTDSLVHHFSQVSRSSCLMCRCAEELPWLLKRAELKEELYNSVLSIDMLIQLYCSGHSSELFDYWQLLDPSVNAMAKQYYKALKKMEEDDGDNSSLAYTASLFLTVGKILRNLSLTDEALPLLQHSLELHESHFDPDGAEAAMAMCELAALYFQAGRFNTAEGFYKQALQAFESACGEESPEVMKVLESLTTVYKKLENDGMMDSLWTRIYTIKQNQSIRASASGILKTRATALEQFRSSHPDTASVERAKKLNELAVILAVYGDSTEAEEHFMKSLQMLETIHGEDHPDILIPLRNLGSFYLQNNKFDWATSLYEKAYEVASERLPPTHPNVTDTIAKLAHVYREQGRLDAAEPLQRQLIELKEREHGPNHFSVAKALNNLAVIYCLQHAYDKAIPLYDRALRIYEENLGLDHPTVVAAVKNRQLALDIILHSQSL